MRNYYKFKFIINSALIYYKYYIINNNINI